MLRLDPSRIILLAIAPNLSGLELGTAGTAPSRKRDRYQIEALLIAHLNAASERYKRAAAARFLNVTDGVPHHPPFDGRMLSSKRLTRIERPSLNTR